MKRIIKILGIFVLFISILTACGKENGSTPGQENTLDSVNDSSGNAGNVSEKEEKSGEAKESETGKLPETEGDIIYIRTPEDFKDFALRVNEGEVALNAVLDADIDMSSVCGPNMGNWIAIKGLEGVFDGNGHVISNLYCVQNESSSVFNSMRGTVKNLEVKNVVMESTEKNAAGLIISLMGTIENCRVSGTVKGYDKAGGIVTDTYKESVVADCVNEASVESGYYDSKKFDYSGRTAGIAAWPREGGEIRGCVNKGEITGNGANAGGIIGSSEKGIIVVEDCVNEGTVSGISQVGGIAGYAGPNTLINRCINNGKLSGTGMVAGIVVTSDNLVLNCANHGDVEATDKGEVYGISRTTKTGLVNCYNTGTLTCGYRAVGIGYSSRDMMMNVYNFGTVTSTMDTGYLTDTGSWSTGAKRGLMNAWAREGCIVIPDGSPVEVQATNATAQTAFTDGTILGELNSAVEKLNNGKIDEFEEGVRAILRQFKEEGEFELSGWVAGSDGLPRFDWE